jgi:IS30 family transposase
MSEINTAAAQRSEWYLSEDERGVIADRLRAGTSTYRAIARELGRAPSTISREVARNRDELGPYRPSAAQRLATARMARPRARRLAGDRSLAALVQGWLDLRWSLEQISAALRLAFPNAADRQLVPESIYQALYANCPVLQRDPRACLRSGRRRRRPHRRGDRRRAHDQTGPSSRRPLSERPAEVEDRATVEHWEGDLITGRANRSAIATLVERASGYTVLVHLPGRHTADVTTRALIAAFTALPPALRRTLAWDRGTELTSHHEISAATGVEIFFADPHSPWQRGSNENTNGLVRQYFPKGSNLALHSPGELRRVQDELNGRPRKRHGWATPEARLAALQCRNE